MWCNSSLTTWICQPNAGLTFTYQKITWNITVINWNWSHYMLFNHYNISCETSTNYNLVLFINLMSVLRIGTYNDRKRERERQRQREKDIYRDRQKLPSLNRELALLNCSVLRSIWLLGHAFKNQLTIIFHIIAK